MELIIGNLLIRHNCVVIPGFGGFVARKVSAAIDYRNGVIQPPRKSVLFNAQLVNNDGLLATELAREKGIAYAEALGQLSDTVRAWQDQLNSGMRITLDKIGYLFLDAERNICFEQDRFFNLLMESYGLAKVHFIPEEDVAIVQHRFAERKVLSGEEQPVPRTVEVASEERQAPVITLNPQEGIRKAGAPKEESVPVLQKTPSHRRAWKYVAAAALLPILFYSYWLPMETNVLESGVLSFRDFNPLYEAGAGTYKPREIKVESKFVHDNHSFEKEIGVLPGHVSVYRFQYDPDLSMAVRVRSGEPAQSAATESPAAETPAAPAALSKGYHFIVGCFGGLENAENLVETLRASGLAAHIVDKKGGLYRVSAGDATSETGLSEVRTRAAAGGYEGWVLKTK